MNVTDIEKCYARIFKTHEGMLVLSHLRKITIERVLGSDSSDAALRTLEGQRALVRQIEHLIQRGE